MLTPFPEISRMTHKMLDDDNRASLSEYSKGVLLVRRDYLPLMIYFGKKEHTYFLTMPPTDNTELGDKFFKWFHNDFVEIVSHIVKKRNIRLAAGQEKPSRAGGKFGWYLPLGVILELQKMWVDEKVPMVMEILRPSDLIYGKGWKKQDIEEVIREYISNNPISTTT